MKMRKIGIPTYLSTYTYVNVIFFAISIFSFELGTLTISTYLFLEICVSLNIWNDRQPSKITRKKKVTANNQNSSKVEEFCD